MTPHIKAWYKLRYSIIEIRRVVLMVAAKLNFFFSRKNADLPKLYYKSLDNK